MDRTKFIGASDAAAVLGLSRWSTPLEVWAEKTGKIQPKDLSNNLPVKLGKKLESTVAELFSEETGKKVYRLWDKDDKTKQKILYHDKYPFLAATLDYAVANEDAVLECKTVTPWKAKEWEGEEIPQEYIIQCYHQLLVTGQEKAYIAVLIGNQDFKWKEIRRDDKALFSMMNEEVKFWEEFVRPDVMPIKIMRHDTDVLYQLFPVQSPESVVELPDAANIIIETLQGLQADCRNLEGLIDEKKNELKALLKENEMGLTGLYKITWKEQVKKSYVVQESRSRVLRISRKEK